MPPRYAYWTILIDNAPTAFRARERDELLPTFNRLRRTNPDIVLKWFSRGRLWDSPQQAEWAATHMKTPREKRGHEWRPGGEHRDKRQRDKRQRDGNTRDRAPKRPSFESKPKPVGQAQPAFDRGRPRDSKPHRSTQRKAFWTGGGRQPARKPQKFPRRQPARPHPSSATHTGKQENSQEPSAGAKLDAPKPRPPDHE